MIERNFNKNNNQNFSKSPMTSQRAQGTALLSNKNLPITSNGFNTTTSNPNFQLSGMQPNYTYDGQMNLAFDASVIPQGGFATKEGLEGDIGARQQYIDNYNNFMPSSTFARSENNSSKLENLRDFSQNSFKDNFTDVKPELFMLDTKNKHNTLYDNLNDELLKETITEIRLNIDSHDRDIEIYPNPFEYVVTLGPVVNSGNNPTVVSRTNIKQELRENQKNNSKKYSKNFNPGNFNNPNNPLNEELFKGVTIENEAITNYSTSLNPNDRNNPLNSIQITADAFIFDSPELIVDYTNNLKKSYNPYLIRSFDNIKFIRLDAGILPKYNTVKINREWILCRKSNYQRKFIKDDYERIKDYTLLNSRYIPDDTSEYNLQSDRFVQIFVREISNSNNLGTNPVNNKSFVLVFDKNLGILYWRGIPYSAVKTYKDSLLGEIQKLSIKFYDSWGNPLTLNETQIDYEKNQILKTDIINPNLLVVENFLNNEKAVVWLIEKMTQILKCFVVINYDIECVIPFYSSINPDEINSTDPSSLPVKIENSKFNSNSTSTTSTSSTTSSTSTPKSNYPDEDCFLSACKTTNSKIVLNQSIFNVPNIYEELDEFVTTSGFVSVKKLTKSGKYVNINIDQYIANVIWFDSSPKYKDFIKFNLESLSKNYKNYGFNVLDTLKNELVNLPANKFFQNYLTFVMGRYTNELNTKVDYVIS
jgi:hypothetical protein